MRKLEKTIFRTMALEIARRRPELTVSQLAKRLGADYHVGKSLMRELVQKRLARKTGKRYSGCGDIKGNGIAEIYQLGERECGHPIRRLSSCS